MKHLGCRKYVHFAIILGTMIVKVCFAQEKEDEDGFQVHSEAKVKLGQMLFFDKILSGNRNISCATCHHPLNGTADGLSLGIGEGGRGLGPARALEGVNPGVFNVKKRIPRNAPALFNLGHSEFKTMFHDGRVEAAHGEPSGFKTPAGENTPQGLESTLAAQALFPPTSAEEMAGEPGSNPVADAAAAKRLAGPDGVWELLAQRIRQIPEYVALFQRAYPDKIQFSSQISFVDVANSIAAFESTTWRADNSPYDRFMDGEGECMSAEATQGLVLFLGKGKCASCHSGNFQTDHSFHSIAMPQIGPGKGDGNGGYHDYGREQVTKRASDRYKFRTPSLRNVALTAPYGHCGAFPDLESTIRHHLRPANSLASYNGVGTRMPMTYSLASNDIKVMRDRNELRTMARQSEIHSIQLTDKEIDQLIEFLHCLTDPRSINMLKDVPHRVPSGLPVYE